MFNSSFKINVSKYIGQSFESSLYNWRSTTAISPVTLLSIFILEILQWASNAVAQLFQCRTDLRESGKNIEPRIIQECQIVYKKDACNWYLVGFRRKRSIGVFESCRYIRSDENFRGKWSKQMWFGVDKRHHWRIPEDRKKIQAKSDSSLQWATSSIISSERHRSQYVSSHSTSHAARET